MSTITAPNADHYPTMRIRDEAYYCELPRFKAGRGFAKLRNVRLGGIDSPKLKVEFNAVGVILIRMTTYSNTEFLWRTEGSRL